MKFRGGVIAKASALFDCEIGQVNVVFGSAADIDRRSIHGSVAHDFASGCGEVDGSDQECHGACPHQ